MPELPEVQTTVEGINKTSKNKVILDVWTDYKSSFIPHKKSIKNPKYFTDFKKRIIGEKIIKAERRGKNILIYLSNDEVILIHMKMTGFFFYDPPQDEKFVHLKFYLNNKKILAFSDMRKFAKVVLIKTNELEKSEHLSHLGPEPLDKKFDLKTFKERLLAKPKGKIKSVLMDQTVLAGVGNIYSDEILWRAEVHPESITSKIPEKYLEKIYTATKETLKKGIDFGGDSMSDYRNIHGQKGKFQEAHKAYRKTGTKCSKKGCDGIIQRKVIGQRSAHFCSKHQILYP